MPQVKFTFSSIWLATPRNIGNLAKNLGKKDQITLILDRKWFTIDKSLTLTLPTQGELKKTRQ